MTAWEARADGEGRVRGEHSYFDGAVEWIIETMRRRYRAPES